MNLSFYKEIAREYKNEFNIFKNCFFPVVMKLEGGNKLHKVKNDSGGWTIFGIAYNHNKKLFKDFEDFKNTTEEEAALISFVKYYIAAKTHLMPYETKLYYFDMCYNMGVSRGIKTMQKCAGVKQDGIIGKITKSKMLNVTEKCLYKQRNSFYNRITEKNHKFSKFLKGWLNRSYAILTHNY